MPWLAALAIVLAVVGIDRWTKIFFMQQSAPGGLLSFSPILNFTRHQNFGLIANLPVPHSIIILISCIILLILVLALIQACKNDEIHNVVGFSLILGGALGNLWDRIHWGYVFDWILLFHTSIINVADIAIASGIVWIYIFRKSPTQKTPRTSSLDTTLKTP